MLYNYLSNALKFTSDEGRVAIRILPEGADAFRVEVEDSGIGIRDDDLPRLFVEFQQLDASTAKKYPGTGLGLALTKRIVEAQGGQIGVRSTAGLGSTFFAVLPRRSAVITESRPEALPRGVAPGAPSVLVIEDDATDQRWLKRTLADAGYAVEVAATGATAIARARERTFDIITLDLLLPDLEGHEVLKAIRTDSLNLDTPVIVVTVMAERGAVAGYHVVDILGKPVSAAVLLQALGRAQLRPGAQRPVLVVDDDPKSVKLAETVLLAAGYGVLCCTNGSDALRLVTDEAPSLVILDLLMEGMSGFEFLRHLREEMGGRIPVVVWTSKDVSDEERSRLTSQAQAVVLKSDGAASLLEEIRHYVPTRTAHGG
jgi:CheY-like chemotaxis protein